MVLDQAQAFASERFIEADRSLVFEHDVEDETLAEPSRAYGRASVLSCPPAAVLGVDEKPCDHCYVFEGAPVCSSRLARRRLRAGLCKEPDLSVGCRIEPSMQRLHVGLQPSWVVTPSTG